MFAAVFIIVAGVVLFINQKSTAIFNPISIVANVSSASLKETDGRTNILILGSDKRSVGNVYSVLTDTIIVASIGRVDNDVVLISLPRDLWVNGPKGFSKINAVYTYGQVKNEGAQDLETVVENVLGIPIHYYVVVDFNIFKETIDVLGGINVNVETAFEDYEYPIEGNEDNSCGRTPEDAEKMMEEGRPLYQIYPCRYEHLSFTVGEQVMNGETALKFSRSRHGNNNEGTDFARAKRQQKVILAVKEKAMSAGTLFNPVKLKELYETYSKNIDTNIGLSDVQGFYQLSQQADFNNIRSIVLDDRSSAEVGGLLYAPTDRSLYGGAYVLIPRAGDFTQMHAYVQKYLFGEL